MIENSDSGTGPNAPSGPRLTGYVTEGPFWILQLLVIALFHRPLLGQTLFFRDVYLLYIPKRLFMLETMRRGELPLWDPLVHGGMPFMANPSSSFFNPLHLLHLILPPIYAFNLIIVLHFALAAAFTYFLARDLGLTRWPAMAAGALYAIGGLTLSTAILMPLVYAPPWLPFSILAVHRFLLKGRRRWLFAASLGVTMPLINGAAEFTGFLLITLLVWLIAFPYRIGLARRLMLWSFLGVVALLLSAVLVVPAGEVVRNSSRAIERSFTEFSMWSVNPRQLPELIVPSFMGDPGTLDERQYWGRALVDLGYPYFISFYFGLVALMLAVAGGLSSSRSLLLPRRIRLAFLVLALAGFLVALGRHVSGFELIYELPLVTTFRYPVKAIFLAMLPMALLSGYAIDRTMGDPRFARRMLYAMGVVVAALLLLLVALQFAPAAPNALAIYFGSGQSDQIALTPRLLHAAGVTASAILLLFLAIIRQDLARAKWLALLVAVDLVAAGWNVNQFAPASLFGPPSFVEPLREAVGEGRLYRAPEAGPFIMSAPSDDPMWLVRANLESLRFYSAIMYRIPVIFGDDYDGLAPQRIAEILKEIDTLRWAERTGILQRAGVSVTVSGYEVRLASVEAIGSTASTLAGRRVVHSVDSTPYRFATDVRHESSDVEALRALKAPFSPDEVILAEPFRMPQMDGCSPPTVRQVASRNSYRRFEVSSECAGLLVVSQTHEANWTARVDGEGQEILRADYAFSAIPVESGDHVVEMTYRPTQLLHGAIVSLSSFVALLAFSLARNRW